MARGLSAVCCAGFEFREPRALPIIWINGVGRSPFFTFMGLTPIDSSSVNRSNLATQHAIQIERGTD
jgi:hypothetical protein